MPTVLSCSTTDGQINNNAEKNVELVLEFEDHSLVVDQDRIRIGSSPLCEIRFSQGPLLHSVIRAEEGVAWIEADDATLDLTVNWRNCRRMALREGDVISVLGHDITVHYRLAHSFMDDAARLANDIVQLTAEELCDQILSEQTAVDEFESSRLNGWQKLMSAIKDVATADQSPLCETLNNSPAVDFSDDCERLLVQIREMSDMMNGRTQQLDDCEDELLAATALLQETQDRVSAQIEELLDQIGESSIPNELRASA